MRLLFIHAKDFEYRVKEKALSEAEIISEDKKHATFNDCLVIFTCVEKKDEENPEEVINNAIENITEIVNKVKPSIVVLYPYAHLSQELAPPELALNILSKLENKLQQDLKIPIFRAPFGWYKEFKLHCYGHPLAELSRTILPTSRIKKIIKKYFKILTPKGELLNPEDYEFKDLNDPLRVLFKVWN